MSYILEALKKAQAERQLGNAPTIHAPQPVQVNAAAGGAAASRKPLLIGLGAGVLVVLAGAAVMWHRAPAPEAQKLAQAGQAALPPAAPQALNPQAAAAGAASATLAVRAPDLPPPMPVPAPVPVPRVAAPRLIPAPAPMVAAPAPSAAGARADARVAGAGSQSPGGLRAPQPEPAPAMAARQPAAQAAAPAPASAPAPAPEDSLPLVQQLPEAIRSQIPRVAFGGYMYSTNPADRLVLVDNTLRHEGEEVAAGLVLEKLMPRAVVMNFRGVRYRVAY
jgi:general secretion pathway protein B